jgi:hypothetical protein
MNKFTQTIQGVGNDSFAVGVSSLSTIRPYFFKKLQYDLQRSNQKS